MKSQKWFLDRIGKTIYRNPNECKCRTCINIGAHGLVVTDAIHAHYLFDIQHAYNDEGIDLNYRDIK